MYDVTSKTKLYLKCKFVRQISSESISNFDYSYHAIN